MTKQVKFDRELEQIVNGARMAFGNGEPLQIRCISESGELLRISKIEFAKKIMAQAKVASLINNSVKDKITDFILKTANRFKSIKDFNLPVSIMN